MNFYRNFQKFLNNSNGLGLLEAVIAAGALGALALLSTELIGLQKRASADMNARFGINNLTIEIRELLSSSRSCLKTFEGVDFKSIANGNTKGEEVITELKDVRVGLLSDIRVQEKFYASRPKSKKRKRYEGLYINSYSLSVADSEVSLEDEDFVGDINLVIAIDKGPNAYGQRVVQKMIRLEVTFDPNAPEVVTSCHSTGLSGKTDSKAVVLNAEVEKELEGLSGNEACNKKNLKCSYVYSSNFTISSSEQGGLSSLCASSYNTNLVGVRQGAPIANIHSCEAKLGLKETFKLNQVERSVKCGGIFISFCQ